MKLKYPKNILLPLFILYLIINNSGYVKSQANFYPDFNQFNYPTTMFNGRTLTINMKYTCTTISVTFTGKSYDYYYDSTHNALFFFEVTNASSVASINCNGVIKTVNFSTVEQTAQITIKKPTYEETYASVGLFTYNADVSINISQTIYFLISEVRYSWYVYRHLDTVGQPDTNTIICFEENIFLISSDTFQIPVSCDVSAYEGQRLRVSMIAFHYYYNFRDTLTFIIIPRHDNEISPAPLDPSITLNKNNDSDGVYTKFQYKNQFSVARSSDSQLYNTSSKSTYINAVYWTASCVSSTSVNCVIDKSGLFTIDDVTNVTSFIVKYTINICQYGTFDFTDGSASDVPGGTKCTDVVSTYMANNVKQSSTEYNFVFTGPTSYSSKATFNSLVKDSTNNKYYIPVYYYLNYNIATTTGTIKWKEYSNTNSNFNAETDTCVITVTLSTANTDLSLEILSQNAAQPFYSISSNKKNLDCNSFRDTYSWSNDVTLNSYFDANKNNFITFSINPRIYHTGNLFLKNVFDMKFYCNYVNKYYLFSYSRYTSTFSTLRKITDSINGIFNPPTVGINLASSGTLIITPINPKPTNPLTKFVEIFDIVYIIYGYNTATGTCSPTNFKITGNNQNFSKIFPGLNVPTDAQPTIYHNSPTTDNTVINVSTNTIVFYPCANCSTSNKHCEMFGKIFFKGSSLNVNDLNTLIDPINTYASVKGIRWYTFSDSVSTSDILINVDPFTGIMDITDANTFFSQTSFKLNLVAFITDENRVSIGNQVPNNFIMVRYEVKFGFEPNFYFFNDYNSLTIASAPNYKVFDTSNLINLNSNSNSCCVVSGDVSIDCSSADINSVSFISKSTLVYYICKFALFPDIINTSPLNATVTPKDVFTVTISNPEYSSTNLSKITLDTTSAVIYQVIDNNNYMTDRFTINLTDKVGSIKCTSPTGDTISNPFAGCKAESFFNYSKSLDTYIFNANTIRILVPDRQSVLQFVSSKDYKVNIEIEKPNITPAISISCFCKTDSTAFTVSCSLLNPGFDQLNLSIAKIGSGDLNPINITINCHSAPANNKISYFGVNRFVVYPNLTINIYNDFFLFKTGQTFSYQPNTTTPWTTDVATGAVTPNHNNSPNQVAYKPYFIYGLAFPYNYRVFDYKTSTFTQYTVINWNSSSIQYTRGKTSSSSIGFCCVYSTDPNVSCSLTNTNSITQPAGQPFNSCSVNSSYTSTNSGNWWTGAINGTDDYKSWMDTLTCNTLTSISLDPGVGNVKCYDNVISIKCMPNLPSGTFNYDQGYIYSSEIKMCIHNIPKIQFSTTSINVEVISSVDLKINITNYIDMRNILPGFIFDILVYYNGPSWTQLLNVTFDNMLNILTVPMTDYSTLFPSSTTSHTLKIQLKDVYDRISSNQLLATLYKNTCPTFNQSGVINLSNWYPGFPKYGYPYYTNSWALFDSNQPTINNIVKNYSDPVSLVLGPKLFRTPLVKKISGIGAKTRVSGSSDNLIEIWWDSPYPNIYSSNTITIIIQLDCTITPIVFTPNKLTLVSTYYPSVPFPNLIPTFKPFIKCVINSSSFVFYNSVTNDLKSHLTSATASYTKISQLSKHYLNDLLYGSSSFPNTSSNPVTLLNSSGTYSLNWPKCQDANSVVSLDLANIPDKIDTNLPSYISTTRGFIVFKNKVYIQILTQFNHVQNYYYRYFPYSTISFDTGINSFPVTFVSSSTIYAGKFSFLPSNLNPNDIAIITSTCNQYGGINLMDYFQGLTNIKSFYPDIPTVDNSNSSYNAIDPSKLCGLIDEYDRMLYLTSEYSVGTYLDIKLILFYYPHFGLETDTFTYRLYKWDKTNINFIALVQDETGKSVVQSTPSTSNPTNLLISYGFNIQNLLNFKYSFTLTDASAKFLPILNVNILNNLTPIYDTSTNTFTYNTIKNLLPFNSSSKIIDVNYSQNKLDPLNDNYKMTVYGHYTVSSHLLRWDYNFSNGIKNLKLYNEDLENLKSVTSSSYYLFNAFYLNFAYVPNKLYLQIYKIDQKTLVSTKVCDVYDSNYYNTFAANLSDYYNSSTFKLLNECALSGYDDEVFVTQIYLANVSDRQDFIYTISSSTLLTNCENVNITESLMIGDYLIVDFPSYKLTFASGSNQINFQLLINVKHKNFEINTTANSQFNYLTIQSIQQWVNIKLPVTINKRIKPPRVKNFWGTSNLIYDSPSVQTLWGIENVAYTYNIKILADNSFVNQSNYDLWSIDRHNPLTENKMQFVINGCSALIPSCTPKTQREDYSYTYQCTGTFSWNPNPYQFDSSLVAVKFKDSSNPNLYSYYYFNVGNVQQLNDPPVISGILCQEVRYGNTPRFTNQQLVECSKNSAQGNRYIMNENKTYMIKLLWSDTDSYPVFPVINSESTYSTKTNDVLALYPPVLTFKMDVTPSNISAAFTQITYDTWLIKITPVEMLEIVKNSSIIKLTYNIDDDKWDLDSTGSNFEKTTTKALQVDFTLEIIIEAGIPYIKDSYNYSQYDLSYWLIPRVYKDVATSLNYNNLKYTFNYEIFNQDFITFPNNPVSYNLSVMSCPLNLQNSDLKFENTPGNDSAMKLLTTKPMQVTMTWVVADQNNTFNTAGCKLNINNNGVSNTGININLCQYFWCRNRNIIYSISNSCSPSNSCLGGDRITLVGQNFPTTIQMQLSNSPSKIFVGNAECNNPTTSVDKNTLNCNLPNIGGRNHFIWVWNDQSNNASGFPTYSVTYQEPFSNAPILTPFNVFTNPDYYYINYPRVINVYGNNFRPSCQCIMTCKNVDYFPITLVKSKIFIECDYNNLTKSNFLGIACDLKVKCLDHPSYKSTGDVLDYSKSGSDIIYESEKILKVYIDEVKITRVNFSSFVNANQDASVNDDYTPLNGSGKPNPHRNGGYSMQITFSNQPACLLDTTNGCNPNYIYLRVDQLYIKSSCNMGNDGKTDNVYYCTIIAPAALNMGNSFLILLSWDYGLTFADKNHSVEITLDKLCGNVGNPASAYYCPAYKAIQVDSGYFCDNTPAIETDLFCKYQRKCMPGTYQPNPGKTACDLVPAGYYLNFFGSNGINVPPKKCPKGYVCREQGLPKYYEICRPGHRCFYEGISKFYDIENSYPLDNSYDTFCFSAVFCPLGTLYSPDLKYVYKTQPNRCELTNIFDADSNVYNYRDLQRLHTFKNAVTTKISMNFIGDLCVQRCKFDSVCSLNEYYYDISGTRSKKGQYRPLIDCSKFSDSTLLNVFNAGMNLDAKSVYQITTDSQKIIQLVGKADKYGNTCYFDPSCGLRYTSTCCNEGACWCPPGFGCDVDDLSSPILCGPGFWRMDFGWNDVPKLRQIINPNIFDFIDSSTDLYKAYSSYFVDKYGGAYVSVSITDFYANNQIVNNTKCLLCPPGYYCQRGSVRPSICEEGFYCEHQFSEKLQCKQGTYNDKKGQFQCKPCPIGFICPREGLTQPQLCPAGYFCPNAGTGTIMQNYNGTEFKKAVICPAEYYCPVGMGSQSTECPLGYKCPQGSSEPIPCVPGTFQNYTKKSFCYTCPRGFYCISTKMPAPEECLPGRICDALGLASAAKICTAGYICDGRVGLLPGNDTNLDYNSKYPAKLMSKCDPGYYCNPGTISSESRIGEINTPQKCNLGEYNDESGRSKCKPCPPGFECIAQGLKNPVKCQKGFWRNDDNKLISCQPCPDGTYGTEEGLDDKNKCIPCPPGVVCVAYNMTLDSFKIQNDNVWKFCPEGFICKNGTSLSNMNQNSCPQGKFCQTGAQNLDDSVKCPAGRVCGVATSVSSSGQIKTCGFDDPNYCIIGEPCLKNYFCPPGTNGSSAANSCGNLISFTGTRDRFYCSRNPKDWDNYKTLKFNYNQITDRMEPVFVETKKSRILQISSSNSTIGDLNSTNNASIDLNIKPIELNDTECMTFTMEAFQTNYLTFNMSSQNGFPPENYDFVFKINRTVKDIKTFYLFDKDYYGSFSEVPLYPDAKFILMKNDYNFTLKILAQDKIMVRISIVYFYGPYFNEFYNNTFLFCKPPYLQLAEQQTQILLDSKNLTFFFTISKSFITENMNLPYNMMYYRDIITNKRSNLYQAAISLLTPNILNFIDYDKYSKKDDKIFDELKDYYVHKSVQVSTADETAALFYDPPDKAKLFGNKDASGVDPNSLVTMYMPFISNCENLGEHISFKKMISNNQCKLLKNDDIQSFSFMSLFSFATGDSCDYKVKCFYDERFDSNKDNWMQYDYGIKRLPLMNISQYAIEPDLFQQNAGEFYIKVPDGDNFDKFASQIPIRVITDIADKKSANPTGKYVPRDVTLSISYYTESTTNLRKIIKASLKLENFEEIVGKDGIIDEYIKTFNFKYDKSMIYKFKAWKFFRENTMNSYLNTVDNLLFLNFYKNTTQFRKYFSNYFNYQELAKNITQADISTKVDSSPQEVNYDNLSPSNLETLISQLAKIKFGEAPAQPLNVKDPPLLPLTPSNSKDIPTAFYNLYGEAYKDYLFNAFILEKKIYNFRVIIEASSWIEALNYNAFPIGDYITLTLIILVLISVNYLLYCLSYKIKPMGNLFKIKLNIFSESKMEKLKFYDSFKKIGSNPFKALFTILKSIIITMASITIPGSAVVYLFLYIFGFSQWFRLVPSHYSQKVSDYDAVVVQKKSDRAIEEMLYTNIVGRVALSLCAFSLYLLEQGLDRLVPNYHPEFIQKSVVKNIDIKKRTMDRLVVTFKIILLMILLIILIFQFSTFFIIDPTYEFCCTLFYQLIISPLIYSYFDTQDNLLSFVINTLLTLTNYYLILNCVELNIMLLLFLSFQFFKFFRIVHMDKINKFYKNILDYTVLRPTKKEKLINKLNTGSIESGDEAEKAALNANIKTLTLICSDLSISFMVLPIIGCNAVMLQYIYLAPPDLIFFNKILIVILGISIALDLLNFLYIFIANSAKDSCYSIDTVLFESVFIYEDRNDINAYDSTNNITNTPDYRNYDKKFEIIRRLGYSQQLFMINFLIGLSFSLLYLGLNGFITVKMIPWYDFWFFPMCLGFKIAFIIFSIIVENIKKSFKIWKSAKIEEKISENLRKKKDAIIKKEESENDTDQTNTKLLDTKIAQVRNRIIDIWPDESYTFNQKRTLILELMNDIKIHTCLHKKIKKELKDEVEKRTKQDIEAKKNKNLNAYQAKNYDIIPNFAQEYSSLGVYNFNREIDLVLKEMTNDRITHLMDVENRFKVRHDILTNLNVRFPNKFAEDVGMKAKKELRKRDDDDEEEEEGNFNEEDDMFGRQFEYLNSKNEPTRPIFLTNLNTEIIENRRTTFRSVFKASEEAEEDNY